MKITVEMTEEEFAEYYEYKKDAGKRESKEDRKLFHANKVLWSIGPAPGNSESKPKYKIVDQEHAEELYEMAAEYVKTHGGKFAKKIGGGDEDADRKQ